MKTLLRITAIFIIVIGFSAPIYADEAASVAAERANNGTLTFKGESSGGPLIFTPSANTLLVGTATDLNYYIGSASSKTTKANGIEYAMVSGSNGYYQKVQATDNEVSGVGTAGEAPKTDDDWISMGGGKAETEASGS